MYKNKPPHKQTIVQIIVQIQIIVLIKKKEKKVKKEETDIT